MERIARTSERSRSAELVVVAALAVLSLASALSSHQLVDPWETHYAEVGREALESGDWVRLRWQRKGFWSKPALTPWLIAGSLRAHGYAKAGGYSGELAAADGVSGAARLPFALLGAFGIVMMFWMVRQLASRRAAIWAALCMGTMPFWFFVSRQAITDMPMAATAVGAIACFVVSLARAPRPIPRIVWRIDGHHLLFAVLAAVVAVQLAHIGPLLYWTDALGSRRVPMSWLVATAPFAAAWLAVYATTRRFWPIRDGNQVTALWGYLLIGVSILGKGPPGLAVAGLTVALVVAVSGRWRWLLSARLIEGVVIVLLVAGPWHLAMLLTDGGPWVNEYFGMHWFARATSGMHGDRGGFLYVFEQLATGVWPWIGLVPLALAAGVAGGRPRTARQLLRAAAAIWAVTGFAFFAIVETKFHHYVLPVVPALAILIALWIEDGRRPGIGLVLLGAGLVAGVGAALATEHKQLIELFVYRYDRPWPDGVRLPELWLFAALAVIAVAALPLSRRWAVRGLGASALVFALWGMHGYMPVAAPHWGQRDLHRVYYEDRTIHAVVVSAPPPPLLFVEVAHSRDVAVGRRLPVRVEAGESFTAVVIGAGDSGMWLAVAGATAVTPPARITVDADRLIAWQLFWRGENFWSGGEIYGTDPASRTAFEQLDSRAFLDYLKRYGIAGRRYWVITEAGRAASLSRILPGAARASVRVEHDASNKFKLLSFVL